MYTGPHIIKDGLVFGYDTGYGVADNDTATRFYPGKPTTNIVPLSLSNSSWFNEYSSGRTLRSETLFGQPVYEFKSNDGQIWVSPFAFNSYDRSTNDLTLSVYAKNIGSSAASMNTYFGGDFSSDSLSNSNNKSIPADNTWRRYSWTRFSSAMSANYLEFRTANTGVVISCPQLEIGRVVTPVVSGTRSSTASLIDLKETTDIDLSNVSFDSTGQPTFDGSDDKIVIADQTSIGAYTYETVVKINNSDSSYSGFGSNFKSDASGYSGVGNGWVLRLDPNGSLQIYTKNNSTTLLNPINISGFRAANVNKYIHLVYTYSNGTNKLYLNGVLQATGTGLSGETPSDSTLIIGAYSWGISSQTYYINAHQPIAKLYNQTYTATEIKQNYNAYKNRFDI